MILFYDSLGHDVTDWQISSSYLKVLGLEEVWIFEQKYHILEKKKKDLGINKNLLLRFGE